MNWESILFLVTTLLLAIIGYKKGVGTRRDDIKKKYEDLRNATPDNWDELPKDTSASDGDVTVVQPRSKRAKK